MEYHDHAMVGGTLAVAVGAQRRHGWPVIALAALAGMVPDWDALAKHFSPETYQAGHRVWGHNLFAVTLAGLLMGGLGFLMHQSLSRSRPPSLPPERCGPWLALGVAILWTHPFLDILYCGLGREAEWPVGLFWPITSEGVGWPLVSWEDRGATVILALGLIIIVVSRNYRQAAAAFSLGILFIYITVRGMIRP